MDMKLLGLKIHVEQETIHSNERMDSVVEMAQRTVAIVTMTPCGEQQAPLQDTHDDNSCFPSTRKHGNSSVAGFYLLINKEKDERKEKCRTIHSEDENRDSRECLN
jgi:hypothetical protein